MDELTKWQQPAHVPFVVNSTFAASTFLLPRVLIVISFAHVHNSVQGAEGLWANQGITLGCAFQPAQGPFAAPFLFQHTQHSQ